MRFQVLWKMVAILSHSYTNTIIPDRKCLAATMCHSSRISVNHATSLNPDPIRTMYCATTAGSMCCECRLIFQSLDRWMIRWWNSFFPCYSCRRARDDQRFAIEWAVNHRHHHCHHHCHYRCCQCRGPRKSLARSAHGTNAGETGAVSPSLHRLSDLARYCINCCWDPHH